MEWKFNFLKKKSKKMQQYSFTNYLLKGRKFQVKQTSGEFVQGEVLDFIDYVTVKNEDGGFLVTTTHKRMKETDVNKLTVSFDPRNPAYPVVENNPQPKKIDPYAEKPQNRQFLLGDEPILNQPTQQPTVQTKQPTEQQPNIFSVFDNENLEIALKVSVKLPKLSLIKDMYKNATNKDDFLNHLTNHVKREITDKIIQGSLKEMIEKRSYRKVKKSINNDSSNKEGETKEFNEEEEK